MAERLRLEEINRLDRSGIILDANIWLYLYCPLGGYNERMVSAYSRCYANLLKSANVIFTDVIVLSEVVNRYLRLAFEQYKREENKVNIDYKRDYRVTDNCRNALSEIRGVIKNRILARSDICNPQYTKESLLNMIDELSPELDFNDQHIIKICNDNGFYLLTHDGDFRNAPVNIVSANRIFWN